ncbi:hypothetical protein DRO69_10060 [Candidatus Bathyarchaeota archaeon]|nr:MAG: hypothetical protein DRO69_10060 [Candidatus Bathyarchaeota archaeon]
MALEIRGFKEWAKRNWKWLLLGAGITGVAVAGAYVATRKAPSVAPPDYIVKFGLVADNHNSIYKTLRADLERDKALPYTENFVDEMNAWTDPCDFIAVLGDIYDRMDGGSLLSLDEAEASLREICEAFSEAKMPVYYVLGNHDIAPVGATKAWVKSILDDYPWMRFPYYYYSFDVKRFHFVVLDGFDVDNLASNSEAVHDDHFYIYDAELTWLKEDLANIDRPTVVFCHVPISGRWEPTSPDGSTYNRTINGAEVRDVLEKSGKVIAVFEAHWHNPHTEPYYQTYMWKEATIPYFGLYSLVDNDNLNSRTRVTLNAKERRGKVESFGELPKTFEFSW